MTTIVIRYTLGLAASVLSRPSRCTTRYPACASSASGSTIGFPNQTRRRDLDFEPSLAWHPSWTRELQRLIWVIERLVKLEPEQNRLLDAIMQGPRVKTSFKILGYCLFHL